MAVNRIERTRRFGLVLAYAVAMALAQVEDVHGHDDAPSTRCEIACHDARPHVSGHASVRLGRALSDCLACQVRSMPQVVQSPGPMRTEPGSIARPRWDPAAPAPIALARPSCRAPPGP